MERNASLWAWSIHNVPRAAAAIEKLQYANGYAEVREVLLGRESGHLSMKPWQSSHAHPESGRVDSMISNLREGLALYLMSTKATAVLTAKQPSSRSTQR